MLTMLAVCGVFVAVVAVTVTAVVVDMYQTIRELREWN